MCLDKVQPRQPKSSISTEADDVSSYKLPSLGIKGGAVFLLEFHFQTYSGRARDLGTGIPSIVDGTRRAPVIINAYRRRSVRSERMVGIMGDRPLDAPGRAMKGPEQGCIRLVVLPGSKDQVRVELGNRGRCIYSERIAVHLHETRPETGRRRIERKLLVLLQAKAVWDNNSMLRKTCATQYNLMPKAALTPAIHPPHLGETGKHLIGYNSQRR